MQKVSWFLRVSAVSALALILAVATLGSSSANAEAALAATAAAPAGPIVPVCVAAAQVSEVRIVHASPNAGDVDIYVDKAAKPLLANVKFGADTGYMGVVAGVHHLTVTKAGDAKTVFFDQDVKFAGQTGYTLVAEGTVANFTVKAIADDLSDTAGMARVEVIHAVSDGPAVDVINTKGNKAIVTNLAYPNSAELNLDVAALAVAQAATPVATAAATKAATAAATAAAPAATAAATKSASVDEAMLAATTAATTAATVAAPAGPTATNIPKGLQPASAGWALSTSKLVHLADPKLSKCVQVAGVTVVGGPADVAGIKAGDLVLAVDGTALKNAEAFQTIVSSKKSGDKLQIEIQRAADGSQTIVTLELGLNPFYDPSTPVPTAKATAAAVVATAAPTKVATAVATKAAATAVATKVATAAATKVVTEVPTATPVPPATTVTLDLAVVATGSTTPLISLKKTTLDADTIYTVIAIGLVGDKTNKAVPIKVLVLTSQSYPGFKAPTP